jgi:hypothetical protein
MSGIRRYGEPVATMVLAVLTALTIVWPEWIEGVFGVDPDAGSGVAEAGVVTVLALATIALWTHHRTRVRARRHGHQLVETSV